VKVEKLAKNGQMVQNCYPLSPGRFWNNPKLKANNKTCPDMTLVEYARLQGSVYVKEFSGFYAESEHKCVAISESVKVLGLTHEEYCGPTRSESTTELLQQAKRALANVVIIPSEELTDHGSEFFADAFGLSMRKHPPRNVGPKIPSNFTEEEILEVKSVLQHDIELFTFAQDLYTKRTKPRLWTRT